MLLPVSVALVLLAQSGAGAARAETSELRMATQFGIGAMRMILMEKNRLLERRLAAAGLPDVKVAWGQFPGGNPMNEGLISGSLDIVSGGTTGFIKLWAKAKGSPQAVRAVGAVSALPLWFMTRDPDVKTLADLTAKHKIALTTVKVSVHARGAGPPAAVGGREPLWARRVRPVRRVDDRATARRRRDRVDRLRHR